MPGKVDCGCPSLGWQVEQGPKDSPHGERQRVL